MRHNVFGRKFSRNKNERRRLFQSLVRELIIHGQIKTTIARARSIKGQVDKLITAAKLGTGQSRLTVNKFLADSVMTAGLIADAKTRFNTRNSGYTRMIRIGKRPSDATEEVIMAFVDAPIVTPAVIKEKPAVKSEVKETKKVEKAKVVKTTKKAVSKK